MQIFYCSFLDKFDAKKSRPQQFT